MEANKVPIGKPLPNKKIYVVADGQLCGVGVPGEIWIGGAGVARGYLNNEALTKERFIANPYGEGNVYRSGDLGRYLEDGTIEYLGRIDEQVKIRGYRIELSEIEHALLSLNEVDQAVVVDKKTDADHFIYAYMTSDSELDMTGVRTSLRQALPEYMIPSRVMQIDKVPVTINGKVDKRQLPDIEQESDDYTEPTTEIEKILHNVFSDVLGLRRISIVGSFFILGGDSIKAMRIVSKLRECGYDLKVQDIMHRKTIESIAPFVTDKAKNVYEQGLVDGEIILTPIVKQFEKWALKKPSHFNQTIIRESKLTDEASIRSVVEELLTHHDVLRAVYENKQLVIKEKPITDCYDFYYEEFTTADESMEQRLAHTMDSIQASINISTGPMVKVGMFNIDEKIYILLVIHHLVVDGVSWRIILEDFDILENQIINNEPKRLPEKTASFKEWANVLKEYQQSGKLLREKAYWDKVNQEATASDLGLVETGAADEKRDKEVVLEKELSNALLTEVHQPFTTEINDILLSALGKTLCDIWNQKSVSIILEGHGREKVHQEIAIDRTVGWFTTMYPMVLTGEDTLQSQIIETKERIRRIPNQGLGYGLLEEATDIGVTFNYLGEVISEDTPIPYGTGLAIAEENQLPGKLALNIFQYAGHMHITVSYSPKYISDNKANEFLAKYESNLKEIAEYCLGMGSVIKTPSDYTLNNMTMNDLILLGLNPKQVADIYELTPMQSGMAYHNVMNSDTTMYVIQYEIVLSGRIDSKLFEQGLDILQMKHEALRTSFDVNSLSIPLQTVWENRPIEFTSYKPGDHVDSWEEIVEQDLRRGFHLKEDSLIRVTMKEENDSANMLLSFHHIILDGWCMSLILGDLFNYYSRLSKGTTVEELKQEIRQEQASKPTYGDYMKWLGEQDEKQGLDYWGQLLADYEGTAQIEPSGTCEPTEIQMKRVGRDCSEDINDRVLKEIQRRGITPSTLMETVWGIVLQQYTNTKDVVFGKVVSGRNVPLDGIEEMVGLFINTVPVRIKTEEKDTLESQLLKVQDQSLASEQYAYNSLADIQENTLMKSDLMKTLVAFENYYVDTKVLEQDEDASFSWEIIKAREETNYDLNLSSYMKGNRLSYDLMYNPNMYSASDIERILDHIEVILHAIVNDISQEISNVERRTTEDVQVIEDLNRTEKEYPTNKTIVELFEEEAAKNPLKTAVVYEGKELTYKELNERANAVAYWLRERGIKSADCVAIKAERSLEMVIGVLGIIKSGGAYVPIDPKYPEERISYMLTDCSASILLVSGKAEVREECEEVSLSETFGDQRMKTNLPNVNTPTDLIYVIYTSGTTGKPKGAMVEHRNVTKLIRNNGMVELRENTVILQTGSMAFDASTFEVWGALANQGTLILSSEDILFDVSQLKDTIQRYGVNTMFMTVALYNQIIEEDKEVFNSVSTLIIGGERLAEKNVRRLKQQDTKVTLYNAYGPTETTTFATLYEIPLGFTKLPIGKPLCNTTIYIVQEGQLCGVGVPGEIWIGGAGVARGYLNNEALTEERFMENPYGEGKLYRSGDLGRYLEDGNIEFLGRIDEQVKIRGYRIELGEIEHALLSLDEVKQAVVIDKKTDSDHFIYSYLTSQVSLDLSEIYHELRNMLPEYAIPSQMMQIDEIPVTINGKVDKRKLPEIKHESKEQVEPRTDVEKTLHNLFVEVLGVKEISVRDSFMMLGGHSLKAVKLANRVHKELDKKVAVSDIIKYQTIEEIALLLEERQTQEYQSLEKAKEKQFYKMSPAQQRMYLQQQLNKDSIVYNIPQLYKVETIINKDKMYKAIDRLVNRHEILRTTYDLVDGMGVQIIHDSLPIDFKYMIGDIGDIAAYIEPFDLEKGPLFRVKVIVSANESYLFLDIHHSVSDGGSTDIFMRELCRLYNGHELKALDFQYKDYSGWINKVNFEEYSQFWKKEFEEIPVVDLPLDFVRPEEQGFKGKMFMKEMDKRIGERVKSFAQKNNVTEYMVFLSIVATLMSKYGRQEDIVIGTPVSGRTHGETEEMLGMFVNTLALHLKVDQENSYRELLKYTRQTFTDALEHQHYPLEALLEDLEIQRDMSRHSLFDVVFSFENKSGSNITMDGQAVEGIPVDMGASKFDLTYIIQELEEGYVVAIEYDTALFKEATITRMYEHIVSLLENALDNADRKVKGLSEISEEDRKMIEKINDTDREFPMDKTIVELFEEEAAKNPSKTAVVYEGTELTYEELNERANAVAYWLRERGIKSADCVAIKAERSLEMVIGVLGIIKSGGAYVPIDPKYPEERISYMLTDCSASILLVSGKAEVREECEEVSLSETFGDQRMKTNLPNVNTPTDLIYVIYTSGTTGKPKGAMVEHRNVTKLVRNNGMVELNENTIILQTGSMAFDASTFEVWGALANQGTLILSSEDILFDVSKLKQTIQRYNVNVMWMTVTLYNQVIEEDHTTFNSLSTLAIGGERLTEKTVRILKQQDTAVRLLNGYGPTETTTFATMYEVPSEFTKLPIGKPLNNTTIYIVQEGQLCGVGVPGEIWIGGAGVTRGYLNNEAFTKERFIANPFGEGKIYRSGDLGRYLEDGTIEYLGRIDEQVKIRGYRIELSEIEHALLSLDEVDQAVVVEKKTDADHFIYAYMTSDSELDMTGVRTSLRQVLPEYMIPSRMMQIDKVPVTINGKVDKRQLPEIEQESDDYTEPTTEIEKILHDVFSDVLGLRRISIMESFFILGGDSIKAMRIVSKLRECGYDLKVQDIMHRKTIESIAPFVTDKAKNVYEQGLVDGEIILTPIVKQFEKWALKKPSHFNQAVIRESKLKDQPSIRSAVEEILTHHDILRAVYESKQLVIKEKSITDCYDFYYEEFTTADESMEQRLAHTMDSIQASINISTGPMVKVGMFNIDEKIYILLVIHHLVVDGVSWRIILEDFETLENQILNDEPKRLPEKTASFKEWANVLKEYQKSEQLLKEKDYWEKVNLEAVESDLVLVETGVADEKREKETVLEKELSQALLTEVHHPFTTEINDILLSALGKTLCDIWNQKSVSIMLEGHGREKLHQEIAIDRTVGWLTTMYPLVLAEETNLQSQIIETKEKIRKIPNQGLGYGLLEKVADIGVIFNYLGEVASEDNTVPYDTGICIAEENQLPGKLAINICQYDGQMHITVTYSTKYISDSQANKFLAKYESNLKEIAEHCLGMDSIIKTLSDYGKEVAATTELQEILDLF
ncbi:amino acid adenylation domain-containing protein [Peribacillus butanolivorans]|uniref:amino acid adenylation domain-containing protein n=1 Tax=Peribacillus butanolivorans TaxID=421767 RepID=UPI0036DD5AE7